MGVMGAAVRRNNHTPVTHVASWGGKKPHTYMVARTTNTSLTQKHTCTNKRACPYTHIQENTHTSTYMQKKKKNALANAHKFRQKQIHMHTDGERDRNIHYNYILYIQTHR